MCDDEAFVSVFFKKFSLTLNTVTTAKHKFMLQTLSAERGRRYRILHDINIA